MELSLIVGGDNVEGLGDGIRTKSTVANRIGRLMREAIKSTVNTTKEVGAETSRVIS